MGLYRERLPPRQRRSDLDVRPLATAGGLNAALVQLCRYGVMASRTSTPSSPLPDTPHPMAEAFVVPLPGRALQPEAAAG